MFGRGRFLYWSRSVHDCWPIEFDNERRLFTGIDWDILGAVSVDEDHFTPVFHWPLQLIARARTDVIFIRSIYADSA